MPQTTYLELENYFHLQYSPVSPTGEPPTQANRSTPLPGVSREDHRDDHAEEQAQGDRLDEAGVLVEDHRGDHEPAEPPDDRAIQITTMKYELV